MHNLGVLQKKWDDNFSLNDVGSDSPNLINKQFLPG